MELIDNPIYQSELKKVMNHAVNLVNLDKKSILMIGASGMIGSFLIDTLMAANEQLGIQIKIYAMGRNRLKLEKRFEKYLQLDTFEIVEGDVTNSIPKEVQADYLIHGASNTHPRAYVTDPIGTIMTNLVGTEQVLKHAVATRTC